MLANGLTQSLAECSLNYTSEVNHRMKINRRWASPVRCTANYRISFKDHARVVWPCVSVDTIGDCILLTPELPSDTIANSALCFNAPVPFPSFYPVPNDACTQ